MLSIILSIVLTVAAALLGGFLYRVRGGVDAWRPYLGDTLPRIAFAAWCGLLAFLVGHDWHFALAIAVCTFAAEILPNESDESMGNVEAALTIVLIGVGRAFIMSMPFWWTDQIDGAMWLMGAGVIAAILWPLYKVLNERFHQPDGTPAPGHTIGWPLQFISIPPTYLIDGYWPMGEFTFGVLICTAIVLA